MAQFDCRVVQAIPTGTHALFIGEVLTARSQSKGMPLLYFNRAYRRLWE